MSHYELVETNICDLVFQPSFWYLIEVLIMFNE